MYILLVDDEETICNGLAAILRRHWPEMTVKTYNSSVEALESMNDDVPNLMITDIRMPEMDGLELIEACVDKGLQYYAVLTGYDEFTLVQKAIRLQALDYLLKPVDIRELFSLVERTKEKIQNQRQVQTINQDLLLRILCKFDLPAEEIESLTVHDLQVGNTVWSLLLIPRSTDIQTVRNSLSTGGLKMVSFITPGSDDNQLQMVLCVVHEDQKKDLVDIARMLKKAGSITGFSTPSKSIQQLHSAYLEALNEPEYDFQSMAQLWLKGESDDRDKALTQLDDWFTGVDDLRKRVNNFLRFANAVNMDVAVWEITQLMRDYTEKSSTERIAALKQWLLENNRSLDASSSSVMTIVEYIRENYMNELTLQNAAAQIYMTPCYFSTLFHQVTDQTFTAYVNRVRINNACIRIAASDDNNFSALSEQVGFQNPHYFYKVFRQMTGMTPGDFRNLFG